MFNWGYKSATFSYSSGSHQCHDRFRTTDYQAACNSEATVSTCNYELEAIGSTPQKELSCNKTQLRSCLCCIASSC